MKISDLEKLILKIQQQRQAGSLATDTLGYVDILLRSAVDICSSIVRNKFNDAIDVKTINKIKDSCSASRKQIVEAVKVSSAKVRDLERVFNAKYKELTGMVNINVVNAKKAPAKKAAKPVAKKAPVVKPATPAKPVAKKPAAKPVAKAAAPAKPKAQVKATAKPVAKKAPVAVAKPDNKPATK